MSCLTGGDLSFPQKNTYMRIVTLILILIASFFQSIAVPPGRASLSGRVTDSAGAPLPGAIVHLPDLHTGVQADTDGRYILEGLPSGRFLVSVSLLGYATRTQQLLLNGETIHNFSLSESVIEQHEIVVTGTSAATEQRRSTTPVQSISLRQLQENASTNIIDAITRVPGVQQLSTGPAISKPIIRGLGGNRIVTLNDGIRQEGQQWGSEHGIEIDDYGISRVEVLKGPASLSYGSDALAGVINIISEEPAPEGRITGQFTAGYQTNNGLRSLHGRLSGNKRGNYWSAYYTGKRAHDYRNAYDGYVFNTRFRNDNYGASVGLSRHWGSSRLSFSSFGQSLGIAEGERDSATGRFLQPVDESGVATTRVVPEDEERSYGQVLPLQRIRHQKLSWVNTIFLRGGSRLGFTLGLQQNDRREFEDVLVPGTPGLHFRLRSLNYSAHYLLAERKGWLISAGVNGMQQQNENLGAEYLIPDYALSDIGAYAIAKKDAGAWSWAGGIRADYRRLRSDVLFMDSLDGRVEGPVTGGYARFPAFTRSFAAPTGSLGVSYAISPRSSVKLNAAAGYRAPNISELASNGVHEGSIRYEYGNPDLKAEQSLQGDLGVHYASPHLSIDAAVFYNYIRNLIYIAKLSDGNGADSVPTLHNEEGYAAFAYAQTNAFLYGGELYMDFHPHPLDWLHLEQTFSYVLGRNAGGSDSTAYLPGIPAPRWLVGLRAQSQRIGRHIGSAYVKLELDNYFRQGLVFSAYETETPAPGYSLLNASIGFEILQGRRSAMRVTIAGQNLGDVGYQHHLSRLRYAGLNPANGRTGIFGMGRNVSLQVSIPLSTAWK